MKTNLILQDIVLNQVRRDKETVTVVLSNGEKLDGTVRGFDNFTIIFDSENGKQVMAYKHSIASITIEKAVLTDERQQQNKKAQGYNEQQQVSTLV